MTAPSEPNAPVLSTLNKDGTRRRIRTQLAKGRFLNARRAVAYGLIALFALAPYVKMGGKPLILIDLPRREFALFGSTFLATDTVLLMMLLVSIVLAIFLLTALFGRVWCGWACPQTVYMEFVYRPIERLLEGGPSKQRRLDEQGPNARRFIKWIIFAAVSVFLAHTFLAYFVGADQLVDWLRGSPFDHPAAFLVMAVTAIAMFVDFAWFREQTCIVACPYGRFQSVLLDRQSMIVGYDATRGEPRGKRRAKDQATEAEQQERGDCIDCGACLRPCPTGIDIREGLQMECIGCTQCIDACDTVMDRIGRPRGLIRYTSKDELAGKKRHLLRPRVVIYPALMAIVVSLLVVTLGRREAADVTVLRGAGSPYTLLPDGRVSNQLNVKVVNRGGGERSYRLSVLDVGQAEIITPRNPFPLGAGKMETVPVFVLMSRAQLTGGQRAIRVHVEDGQGFARDVPYRLIGPLGPAKGSAAVGGEAR